MYFSLERRHNATFHPFGKIVKIPNEIQELDQEFPFMYLMTKK